jgi:H+/Cl- antiporter ClcA
MAGDATPPTEMGVLLHSRAYLGLLLVSAVLGIPLSLVAFGFLAAVHELEHLVWHSLPESLGYDVPPAWWPILAIGFAGVLVGLVVLRLPGRGGHVPAHGTSTGAPSPRELPGVVLAATASLALGAVVGPEAPLIAIGGGLALLAVRRTRVVGDTGASAAIAASGAAAAISSIFGNPLVAAVMFLEIGGLARRRTLLIILPCLVSSGVGAIVFTGLGSWTGFETAALALPDLESSALEVADVVWAIPVGAAIAVATWCIFAVAHRVAGAAESHTLLVTVGAGLVAGTSAAVYVLLTDHTPVDVALSGQQTLGVLATHPESWSTGALVVMLVCKGLAYAVCLGTFRGGQLFPAVLLGAGFGVLASSFLPGLGHVPALAIGMAAGVAVTRLPITSVLLVVLLLGDAATNQMPVIILAAVAAFVVDEMLTTADRQQQAVPAPA